MLKRYKHNKTKYIKKNAVNEKRLLLFDHIDAEKNSVVEFKATSRAELQLVVVFVFIFDSTPLLR